MASLKDTQQLLEGLEELVGQLKSEMQDGDVDFEKVVSTLDELSERADGLAETFNDVNEALMQRLQGAASGGSSGDGSSNKSSRQGGSSSPSESKAGSKS
jgi:methyl-accepting chemotaxis protein